MSTMPPTCARCTTGCSSPIRPRCSAPAATTAASTRSRARRPARTAGRERVTDVALSGDRHALGLDRPSPTAPPGYHGEVPFGFGIVELPEGRARDHPARRRPSTATRTGSPMQLRIVPLHTDEDGTAGRRRGSSHHERRSRSRSPGIGIHPFGRFEDRTVTDMGVTAVRAALAEAGVGRGDFQAAFCGTAYAGVAAGHKVLGALALTGIPIVDIEAGLRERRGGAAARGRRDPGRPARLRARVRHGEDAEGDHPLELLRALARGGRARRDPRVLRAAGAAAPARVGPHQGRPRPGRREEPAPRREQPERDVPQGGHGRGGARARGSSATRCTSSCSARPTRARRRSCCARRRARIRTGSRWRRRCCARTSRAACSARPLPSPASTTRTSRRRARSPRRTRTPRPASVPDDVDVVECQDTDAARELLAWEELGLCAPG